MQKVSRHRWVIFSPSTPFPPLVDRTEKSEWNGGRRGLEEREREMSFPISKVNWKEPDEEKERNVGRRIDEY